MHATFELEVDRSRSLLLISMGGFFEQADIARFAEALPEAQARLDLPADERITLVDIRNMKIQSQESVSSFSRLLNSPKLTSRQLAFVTGASLARMQIQRAAAARTASYFATMKEARAWIDQQATRRRK